MAAPTLQQTNLVNKAASVAYNFAKAYGDAAAFLSQCANSPTTATIASVDFSAPSTPGPLQGMSPTEFTNFIASLTALQTAVSTPLGDGQPTIAGAVQTLAERANQT